MTTKTYTTAPSISSSKALTLTPIQLEFLTDQVGAMVCNSSAMIDMLAQLVSVKLLERSIIPPREPFMSPFDELAITDLPPDMLSETAIEGLDSLRGIEEQATAPLFVDDAEP